MRQFDSRLISTINTVNLENSRFLKDDSYDNLRYPLFDHYWNSIRYKRKISKK